MQCMAMLVPIIICYISALFLQVCSVVAQFGIVCVGLLLLILYHSRALFYFHTPPHSLLCISTYHTTVSYIKFCFVAYKSLHIIVFVFQVLFKLDLVWCWGAWWNFFVFGVLLLFCSMFGCPQLSKKKIIDIFFCLYLNPHIFFSLFAEFHLNQSSIGVMIWCWSSLYMWCIVWCLLFLWCWWPH